MSKDIKYQCDWEPKEDITAFELARCLPYTLSKLHSVDDWDKLDEGITRHFKVMKYDYGEMIRNVSDRIKSIWDEGDEEE